ncbi:glycosyltransferase family 4 protein [Parablastomonas sp. CN1-191]|uniref:glycosyltransferase family 4 protein n=1 Tax=Parablastomonas sp. CN1-191 TaxID=3400908 RepID=UPI003BF7F9F5
MSTPLRLVILGQDSHMFARPGGAPNDTRARHLEYVREFLRRRPGSEVRIIVHTRRGDGFVHDRPFAGLEIFGTDSPSRLRAPLDMLRLLRSMLKKGWQPDLITCQTGYEEGLVAFLSGARRARIQVQVHADVYGAAFAARGRINRLRAWGTRRAIRRADHVRVVSSGIERAIVAAGDMPADRIAVAPVPVAFAAQERRPDAGNPVLLFVGRLVPEKDLGLWCRTARLVREAMPEVRLVIAGDGPERAVVARELAGQVDALTMKGAVAYDDLPALFAAASLFLFTSEHEGLGRVVVEAMMAGLPIVSTDIDGPRDLIQDGATGRLVPRDAASLADACLALLRDPARADAMAAAARAWADAHYSFAAVTRRLVDSWEAAAALPRRRP